MPLILDGNIVRKEHEKNLSEYIKKLGNPPKLSIFQVGNDERSTIYIEQKKKCGAKVGINVEHVHLKEDISFEELKNEIDKRNINKSVSGIIIQLPLPEHLEKQEVIDLVNPKKDVDGLTSTNKKLLENGDDKAIIPATAKGILSLLSFYNVPVNNKKIAVLGRSDLVGRPTALLLSKLGGKVSVCHSKTPNTKEIVLDSEIVVVAVGKPHLIEDSYVKKEHIIIDVGMNSVSGALLEEIPGKKVVGDVDFAKVAPKVTAISPVPGGVGPMTVISLMENVFSAECDRIARAK